MEDQPVQNPTPTSQPAPTTQPQATPPSPKSSKLPLIIIAILLILLIPLGGYFLLNQTSKKSSSPTPTPQEQTQAPTETASTPTPTIVAMKTYTSAKISSLSFKGYSLKHSTDWSEKETKTDVSTMLELTKGEYQIVINQTPTEGGGCAYKDSDMDPSNPFIQDKRGKPYTDVVASFGTLRRDQETAPSGVIIYPFCQEANDGTGSFGSFTSVGILEYNGPKTAYSPTTLFEMDEIVKSIKTL